MILALIFAFVLSPENSLSISSMEQKLVGQWEDEQRIFYESIDGPGGCSVVKHILIFNDYRFESIIMIDGATIYHKTGTFELNNERIYFFILSNYDSQTQQWEDLIMSRTIVYLFQLENATLNLEIEETEEYDTTEDLFFFDKITLHQAE